MKVGRAPVRARLVASLLLHLLLVGLAGLMVMPLLWTISTSLKSPGDAYVFPPEWLPSWPFYWENYLQGFTRLPFGLFYRNTIFLTVVSTLGATLSSALVGYAFARYRAPGSDAVFTVLLATMMIPYQVTMIPQFILFKNLGWVNTFLPLIVPFWLGGGAFYIFLLRQFLRTVPKEFDNAARIDGANDLQILTRIVLPLSKAVIAVIALFYAVGYWNNFFNALLYLNNSSMWPLSLVVRLRGGESAPVPSAAVVVAILPILLVYPFLQRYFTRGVLSGAIKG